MQVPPERPDLLAQAIEALADDPQRRDGMGQRARIVTENAFSWRVLVPDWVRQLGEIMAGRDPVIPDL